MEIKEDVTRRIQENKNPVYQYWHAVTCPVDATEDLKSLDKLNESYTQIKPYPEIESFESWTRFLVESFNIYICRCQNQNLILNMIMINGFIT